MIIMRTDRPYVGVHVSAMLTGEDGAVLRVGAASGLAAELLSDKPHWDIPMALITSRAALATAVDEYAKMTKVRKLVAVDHALFEKFNIVPGMVVEGFNMDADSTELNPTTLPLRETVNILLVDKDMTKYALSKRMGIQPTSFDSYLRRDVRLSFVQRISAALDMTIDEFMSVLAQRSRDNHNDAMKSGDATQLVALLRKLAGG